MQVPLAGVVLSLRNGTLTLGDIHIVHPVWLTGNKFHPTIHHALRTPKLKSIGGDLIDSSKSPFLQSRVVRGAGFRGFCPIWNL
mmetsp:Transcript_7202/g.8348  ORF Transcript_7202/g.8348 Transcript_7202/m.8348 type:complete len:84 (+) Transcript_7202:184-435(+)